MSQLCPKSSINLMVNDIDVYVTISCYEFDAMNFVSYKVVFYALLAVGSCQNSVKEPFKYYTSEDIGSCSAKPDAEDQLCLYKKSHEGKQDLLTTGNGSPIGDKLNLLTIGSRGPALLQDTVFIDEIAHFDRERIPERVVHAKGAGAFGYFEVTDDITRYTKAKLFSEIGKRTDVAIRFSTVVGESGSADTVRDPRGFAVKFYTEEGNWDVAGLNTPTFFVRDAMLFSSLIHSQKRNPVTHLKDWDMYWDFLTLRPETTHQLLRVFSDRGTPDGYRYMDGFGVNTFELVNKDGDMVYSKFHFKTDLGLKNLTAQKATELAGSDPDYATRDLYNAIADSNFPSWIVYIQVMTWQQAQYFQFNPFDPTKVWSEQDYPLIQVGKLVLNRNPKNYFSEVEQIAFAPSRFVPGIQASPDKILQGRLFSYPDTQRYRLGVNNLQIPVNCPYQTRPRNYQRDGFMTTTENQDGAPNYYPNSFNGPVEDAMYKEAPIQTTGDIDRYNSADDDNFTQAGQFYRDELTDDDRQRLVENIYRSLIKASDFIQERAVNNFALVDAELGQKVQEGLQKLKMKNRR